MAATPPTEGNGTKGNGTERGEGYEKFLPWWEVDCDQREQDGGGLEYRGELNRELGIENEEKHKKV